MAAFCAASECAPREVGAGVVAVVPTTAGMLVKLADGDGVRELAASLELADASAVVAGSGSTGDTVTGAAAPAVGSSVDDVAMVALEALPLEVTARVAVPRDDTDKGGTTEVEDEEAGSDNILVGGVPD